ncbi:MAG: AAA family ATPase [Defluviitaleaceae bacterium]|nr:AAA family ATPase [Defluviitaleaceae bacterium]
MSISIVQEGVSAICANIEKIILGNTDKIRLILAVYLAGGHVLLEDVPGTGKTVLAKSLARSMGVSFGRVQFTPDLLPSELVGINFYNPKTGEFEFRKGSLFANIVLADEINRATPRTQSGLLESMEERQVSVDGTTYPLPSPYFVIATQNPIETQGTFPLPEAQLDRFMIQTGLGYPTAAESAEILKNSVTEAALEQLRPVCGLENLQAMQAAVKTVHIHDDIYKYIVNLAEATRTHEAVSLGVSTRGAIGLAKAAQAYCAISGKDFVSPGDVLRLLPHVFAHRIILKGGVRSRASAVGSVLEEAVAATKAPVEDWKGLA